ncbi:hypothetical protein G7Y89_g4750 [Cudoniella acicularis]|uniref:Heterokaryon incompatibility domain-containing protein n=1 Tax=Cudoniella acicularis TaxID=354080 RepID=A0A8H4RRV9_9HELO|nr:hypothetical protein G7Y89_g4750 [Cudoniella acicularis]
MNHLTTSLQGRFRIARLSSSLRNGSQQQCRGVSPSTTTKRPSHTLKSAVATSLLVSLGGALILAIKDNDAKSLRRSNLSEYLLESSLSEARDELSEEALSHVNDKYIYRPLPEGAITRIMVLQPGSFDETLEFYLETLTAWDDVDYEALSYAWGNPERAHKAICSKKSIGITANLDGALRRLRHSKNIRHLWVDAICINQDDKAEKAVQVNMMQEIYENAKQVNVWLGEPSGKDELAFTSLRHLRGHLKEPGKDWFRVRFGWGRDNGGRIFSGGAQQIDTYIRNREVASARNAIVLYGGRSMQWEAFADVYMKLGDYFLPVTQFGGTEAAHSLESITAIESARRAYKGPLSMSLFHILVATSSSECSDPRDKIYAVQGLARNYWSGQSASDSTLLESATKTIQLESSRNLSKGVRQIIALKTSYILPVEEVYLQFAMSDSRLYRDLRALSCATGTRSSKFGLPSWVPDWTIVENSYPFVQYSDRTQFAASGRMKAVAWHSKDELILNVTGKQIDSIRDLGQPPSFSKAVGVFEINEKKVADLERSLQWLNDCVRVAASNENRTEGAPDALWRAMTCGLTGEGFPAPKFYADYFNKYMEFLNGTDTSPSAPERFAQYFEESRGFTQGIRGLDEFPHYENHARIEASIYKWASKRRFCKTASGRLGFVPNSAQEGDVICIMYGGEVPYVLRPAKSGFFKLVGECFIDGIMHGEGLSEDAMEREFQLL